MAGIAPKLLESTFFENTDAVYKKHIQKRFRISTRIKYRLDNADQGKYGCKQIPKAIKTTRKDI